MSLGGLPLNTGPRLFAALTLGGGATLLLASAANGEWSAGQAPWPFVWRDVALVHFVCALPLAWFLSRWTCRWLPAAAAVLAAAVVLGLSLVPAIDAGRPPWLGAFTLRIVIALFVLAALLTLGNLLIGFRDQPSQPINSRQTMAMVAVALAALLIAPFVYVPARCRHDLGRLGDYLDQGRLGEADSLAHAVLALDAHAQWRGHPLVKLATSLDDEAAKLKGLVKTPLPADANAQMRLERARQLAMLGETDQALAILPTIEDGLRAADADNLRGTIHEARGEWTAALGCFQRARDQCQPQTRSPQRAELLVRAITGMAYNQCKAGDYVAADKSYQELLAIAPNADTHFVLAQFYEDAQNASKSKEHARRAMLLNPSRYQAEGEKLIRKLSVFHFGCLRAFGG